MNGRRGLGALLLLSLGACGGPAEPPDAGVRDPVVLFGDLRVPMADVDGGSGRLHGLDFAALTVPSSAPGGEWQAVRDLADRLDVPGRFAALPAVDYAPGSGLRTVIFRGPALPERPLGEPADLEALWAWMDELRDRGMAVLAVARPATPGGTASPSLRRGRNEPLTAVAEPGDFADHDAELLRGIGLESAHGANPFQLGLVAATAPAAVRALTGVWADANTREAVYAALRRRETFATLVPPVALRLSAGFRHGADDPAGGDVVPMGGDLLPAPGAPTFVARAVADPAGPDLKRLQMVKGWVADGTSRQAVYDVACGDGSAPAGAECPRPEPCDPDAEPGRRTLSATWQDPQFDPAEEAYYYVRVLSGAACAAAPRAWSSPIWYHGSVR